MHALNLPKRRAIRLLAPLSLIAALAVGGVAFASSASAATTVPASITAPTTLTNDNSPGDVSVTIDNSAGNAAITSASLDIALTVPTGLTCDKLTLTATFTGAPALTAGAASAKPCTFDMPVASIAKQTKVTYTFTLAVNGRTPASGTTPASSITGTISTVATLTKKSCILFLCNTTTVAQTAPATTTLIDATPPTLNTTAPTTPIVHVAYSYQVFTSLGTGSNPTDIKVFRQITQADGTKACTKLGEADGSATFPYPTALALTGSPFVFNAQTATISATAAALNETVAVPKSTYVIIANNGTGGAKGTLCGDTAANDVEATIVPQILFSDTAITSTFGTAIYTLADNGIIGGYDDGTFRGTGTVTRQAFAHFVAAFSGAPTGACQAGTISVFPDVPTSSPFCQDIRWLAENNIVKGYSNGSFGPGKTISRQAIAAFIVRTYQINVGYKPSQVHDSACTKPIPFPDVTASNPFCGDIEGLIPSHIATGFSDGKFHPADNASRQATASFIFNLAVYEKHTFPNT